MLIRFCTKCGVQITDEKRIRFATHEAQEEIGANSPRESEVVSA